MSSHQNQRKGRVSTTPARLAEKLTQLMLEKEKVSNQHSPNEPLDAIEREGSQASPRADESAGARDGRRIWVLS